MQDKEPINEQGKAHGYWEKYYPNSDIVFKGNYINGEIGFGYYMFRWVNGKIKQEYYAR